MSHHCFLGRNCPSVETFAKAARVRFFSHFGVSLHGPCLTPGCEHPEMRAFRNVYMSLGLDN